MITSSTWLSLTCGALLVAVRHIAPPAEIPEIGTATCQPSPMRHAAFVPRIYCRVRRHLPAPLALSEPGAIGCAPDVPVIAAARVPLHSGSVVFWAGRSAFQALHLLDAIRPNFVYLFLGQETSAAALLSSQEPQKDTKRAEEVQRFGWHGVS